MAGIPDGPAYMISPERARDTATRVAILPNVISGLTVSFVAISLGAAFGVLSGRGAFAGILSAGLIALVTSALGGTRVQCSGPTAPMTAVTALLVGFAHSLPDVDSDRFVNLVIILSGILVLLFGVLRLGRFIALVPRVVISGFMSGIAILIWIGQGANLIGIGRPPLDGDLIANITMALVTFAFVTGLPGVLRRFAPRGATFLPVTLVVIVGMSAASAVRGWNVEYVTFDVVLRSVADFQTLVTSQLPADWSGPVLRLAFPFAVQLAILCYLDTLLTSLVMDRMSGEQTRQNRELAAQGLANTAVAFVGGIPGAQATIRSVLVLKEGATLRLAGILVGVFVLVEMFVLQDLVRHIPVAVLTGILFKVGYDVFDWRPVQLYFSRLSLAHLPLRGRWAMVRAAEPTVSTGEIAFITGTAAVTVAWDLNAAVIGATILFHVISRFRPMRDLLPPEETLGLRAED